MKKEMLQQMIATLQEQSHPLILEHAQLPDEDREAMLTLSRWSPRIRRNPSIPFFPGKGDIQIEELLP